MTDDGRIGLIDAHLHFWDLSAHRWYPVIQEEESAKAFAGVDDVSRMVRDFAAPQLLEESSSVELLGAVHISAVTVPRTHLEEARWIEGVLDELGVPAATVGALERDQSRAEMEADLDAQASDRFRGIRVIGGIDPESAFAADLFAVLDQRGLVFDLVAHPPSISAHLPLLERNPDLQVVLEHVGWPQATDESSRLHWRRQLGAIAELPNVTCKVSGIGMATHALDADTLRPWVEGCLDAFGPERCLFGSNFPVDAMYGGYAELVRSVRAVVDGLPVADRRAFWVENAQRLYRI